MKLHKKLMIVYLVTILLPIVGLTNYFLNQMSDLIIRYVSDSYQKILVQSNNGIYYNIRFYESILDNLTVSESVQNVLSEPEVYLEKGVIIMNLEISRAVRLSKPIRRPMSRASNFSPHHRMLCPMAYTFFQ